MNLIFPLYYVSMNTQPEVAAPTGGPAKETVLRKTLPILEWPMNKAVLKNPYTKILPSSSIEGPGIAIHTLPGSAFAIRSPIDGRMGTFEQPDKSSTGILMPEDPSLLVVLGNMQSTSQRQRDLHENEFAEPDSATEVKAGEIIGTYRSTEQGLIMHVARLYHDPTTATPNWELIDPRAVLPTHQ